MLSRPGPWASRASGRLPLMGDPEISVLGGGEGREGQGGQGQRERSEVIIPPLPHRTALHNFPVKQSREWAVQTCKETHACSWEPTSTGARHSLLDPPHKAGTSLLYSVCFALFSPLIHDIHYSCSA